MVNVFATLKRWFLGIIITFVLLNLVVDNRATIDEWINSPKVVGLQTRICQTSPIINLRHQYSVFQNDTSTLGVYAAAQHQSRKVLGFVEEEVLEPSRSFSNDIAWPYIRDKFNSTTYPYNKQVADSYRLHCHEVVIKIKAWILRWGLTVVNRTVNTCQYIYQRAQPHISKFIIHKVRPYSEKASQMLDKHISRLSTQFLDYYNDCIVPGTKEWLEFCGKQSWKGYVRLRLFIYVVVYQESKLWVYHFHRVKVPAYYGNFKSYLRRNIVPYLWSWFDGTMKKISSIMVIEIGNYPRIASCINTFQGIGEIYSKHLHTKLYIFYTRGIKPMGNYVARILGNGVYWISDHHTVQPCILKVSEFYDTNIHPWLLHKCHIFEKLFTVPYFATINGMQRFINRYYGFLTSGPSNQEVQRLSDLLVMFDPVEEETQISTEILVSIDEDLVLEKLKETVLLQDKMYLEGKVSSWQTSINNTCESMFEEFWKEYREYEKKFMAKSFTPTLQQELANMKNEVSQSMFSLQEMVRSIDSVDVFTTNQDLVVNENSLKTPKSQPNTKLKYFKNKYRKNTQDSYGLSHKNYLRLVEEISYINDWMVNSTSANPDGSIILGKKVKPSFGNINRARFWKATDNPDPEHFLVQSDLLKRITVRNFDRKQIMRIEKPALDAQIQKTRVIISQQAATFQDLIPTGVQVLVDKFNSLKFRTLDVFENFSDVVLENWQGQFLKFLESQTYNEIDLDFLFAMANMEDLEEVKGMNDTGKFQLTEKLQQFKKSQSKSRSLEYWRNFKIFYNIKKTLIEAREYLNRFEPDMTEVEKIAKEFQLMGKAVVDGATLRLDGLCEEAMMEFVLRKEASAMERVRRFENFN
ncbi:hypothetical protein DASC09_043200 [Saccharomycopsis crataegensis]|uniref:Uncharacterized protein n=1 Tax=Saccharomycopsis crataegensis TaxID=43959 RepID=A0AAV5QRT0_9ASCO|nr:hypothetical protein DASC09_043200 [Saccharomycopsis crataegensis]